MLLTRDGHQKLPEIDEHLAGRRLEDERRASARIRCPLCEWRPTPSSEWCCDGTFTPESPFPGCGTVWNTFQTFGRCPGCGHQWRWTSCLRCGGWSLHEDWYAQENE